MTTLYYDIDNFSGKNSRGTRYNIYVDGILEYSDISEDAVDKLCDDLEARYHGLQTIEAIEIS